MSGARCAAFAFLNARGPAAVPFQLCCAIAIVAAGGTDPQTFVCGAAPVDPSAALLWPEPDTDLPLGEPAR
jgi:hypothetical protein